MPPALSEYSESDPEEEIDVVGSIESGEVKHSTPIPQPSPKSGCQREKTSTVRESEEQSPQLDVRVRSNSVSQQRSKGRKTPAILQGLDIDNILHEEEKQSILKDTPLTSSITTSSYKTRTQVRGSQKSHLCYDTKYHPMDDVIRPSQAAKHKSKHGEFSLGSDETLFSSFDDGNHTESDTDLEDDQPNRGKRKSKTFRPSTQPSRRTTRSINKAPLYNMDIHPQDADLDEMSVSSQSDEPERKRRKQGSNSDEEVSENEHDLSAKTLLSTIADSENMGSEDSAMSTIRQEQPSEAELDQAYHDRMQSPVASEKPFCDGFDATAQAAGFTIYEETLAEQMAKEASAPVPLEYYEDDKENEEVHPDMEPDTDIYTGITVHPAPIMRPEHSHTRDDAMDRFDFGPYLSEPAELEADPITSHSTGVLHVDGAGDSYVDGVREVPRVRVHVAVIRKTEDSGVDA